MRLITRVWVGCKRTIRDGVVNLHYQKAELLPPLELKGLGGWKESGVEKAYWRAVLTFSRGTQQNQENFEGRIQGDKYPDLPPSHNLSELPISSTTGSQKT